MPSTPKICQYCGKSFTIYAYREKHGEGKYCSNSCRIAGNRGENSPLFKNRGTKEWKRHARLIMLYGLSMDDYKKAYTEQNGRCAICGERFKQLQIDHNHDTNQIRGLLCWQCNLLVGHLENPKTILASKYLESYNISDWT